jgi:hypothetical protein
VGGSAIEACIAVRNSKEMPESWNEDAMRTSSACVGDEDEGVVACDWEGPVIGLGPRKEKKS